MGLSHFYDIVLALDDKVCFVFSGLRRKVLTLYIYIYIVKGNTLHVGGLFELSCPDRTTCTHCTLIQRAALRLPEMACLLTASLANRKMMCSDVAPLPSLEMIYMQAYRA